MNVFFIVTCLSEENAFGATLFLKTVRTGFPTSSLLISVNENFPVPGSVVSSLKEFAARDHNTAVGPLQEWTNAAPGEEHGAFIRSVLEKAAAYGVRDVVFSDTDIVFWESMEDLALPPGKLYAGRFIPEIFEFSARMAPRVHPSMFFVPDPAALFRAIEDRRVFPLPHVRPFEGFAFVEDGEQRVFDTLASLSALLPDQMYRFGEKELDRYDHLFCGTFLDIVDKMGEAPGNGIVHEAHAFAKRDSSLLKGIWRRQEVAFLRSFGRPLESPPAVEAEPDRLPRLRGAEGSATTGGQGRLGGRRIAP